MTPKKTVLLWLGLSFTYLLCAFYHWDYFVDDAFISYRYAENLAHYGEIVYSPGLREEGYTSFLWILLLAPFSFFFELEPIAKGIAISSTLGIFYWFYRLSSSRGVALAVFSIWIMLPITWMNSVNGMETLFYTFLLTAQSAYALQFFENPEKGSAWKWAIFAFLTGLTRPEGNLFTFIFGIALLLKAPRHRSLRKALVFFFVLGSAYFIARLFYFHYPWNQPWPNPFLFKVSAAGTWFKAKGITYVRDFLREPLFPLLLLLAYFHFMQKANLRRGLFLFFPILLNLAFFLTVEPIVEYFYRFLIPLVPVALLALLPSEEISWGSFKTGYVAIFCCIFLGWGIEYQKQSISGLIPYFSTPLKRTHQPIGKALASFSAKGYLLATSDAGVLPYFARWPTLDLVGLNYRPFLLKVPTLAEFFQLNPTILVLHDHSRSVPCNIQLERMLYTEGMVELSKRYERLGQFYHRRDLDMEVYVLKTYPEKEALKKKIEEEVKNALKRYPP